MSTVRYVLLFPGVRPCTWTLPLLRIEISQHTNVTREIIDAASPIRQVYSPEYFQTTSLPPALSLPPSALDLHPSAEHRVLILLDPSANAQALDPNVLASGIR